MKSLMKLAVLSFMGIFLSGCLTTLDPIDDSTYVSKPNTAVIIIGKYSQYVITTIIAKNQNGDLFRYRC